MIGGFTKRYGLTKLVYYEAYRDPRQAITREKQLKGGSRAKKIALIREINPEWRDLYLEVCGVSVPPHASE